MLIQLSSGTERFIVLLYLQFFRKLISGMMESSDSSNAAGWRRVVLQDVWNGYPHNDRI